MDEQLQAIVDAERKRLADFQERQEDRLGRARMAATRIAADLERADPAVREVWLFGSVSTGRVGNRRFDVDLAVRGGDIVSLLAGIRDQEFAVDLVDLDGVSDAFRAMILRRETRLYPAPAGPLRQEATDGP